MLYRTQKAHSRAIWHLVMPCWETSIERKKLLLAWSSIERKKLIEREKLEVDEVDEVCVFSLAV